ncbi:hypothetical protein [Arthrobacter sp. ISL-5]|uniref:hypothetical protein n=1 Tax=Arthrobacter sp. ISL-5 TaxID=2819111 RepID=UPI001BECCC34|nr:hypothetical protein [Arthrobacter sp. ISL-5]MBT2555262.1 hypothetical protein [Arthrobacter sp. ISL-5]
MGEDAYLQERWVKAERIANGEEEPAIDQRRRWWLVAALVLVAGVLMGILAALFLPRAANGEEIEAWRRVLSVALAGMGLILIVGAFYSPGGQSFTCLAVDPC